MASTKKPVKAKTKDELEVTNAEVEVGALAGDLDEKAEKKEETQESTKSEAVKDKKPELVKIKLNADLEAYIGDKFYRLKANEIYEVPENVKEILGDAGYLAYL